MDAWAEAADASSPPSSGSLALTKPLSTPVISALSPKETPSKEDPPKEDPPKEDLPKETQPKGTPLKRTPPKRTQPKRTPPKETPPKKDPPKEKENPEEEEEEDPEDELERVVHQQLAVKDENQKAEDAPVPVKFSHSTNYSLNWVDDGSQHGYIKDQLGHSYTWNQMKPRMDGGIGYKCTRLWEKRCTAVVRRFVTDDEEMMFLERLHSHPMRNKRKLDAGNSISFFLGFILIMGLLLLISFLLFFQMIRF